MEFVPCLTTLHVVQIINVAQISPAMSKTSSIERKLLNVVAKESLLPNNNNLRRIKFARRVSNAVSTDLHMLSFNDSTFSSKPGQSC